ncbi:MAG TPA: rRNA maturation RNase YbeY [Labilithrix sp.]|nr:rRNA maturation RNase YbeY [Labilithrix sp.]
MSLSIERGPYAGIKKTEVLRRIQAMIAELQLEDREVSFLLTDDKRIHQLNKIYRHIDRPTDVLAFAMQEGEFAELAGPALGDVIVSVPTARKQADERDVSVLSEVTMLVAHGLLHLLGWDHETPAKDRRMRAETERLCRAAEPLGPSSPAGRTGRAASTAAPRRSKQGAKQALSRNRSAVQRPSRGEKVQAPHHLKARRSRKG